jgi:hypothetical protein
MIMELSMKLSRLEGLVVQGNEPPQNLDPNIVEEAQGF